MRSIPLTRGLSVIVEDYDYDWLNQWRWYAFKGRNTFYAARNVMGKTILMHRVILGLGDNALFGEHEDGNGLNNRRGNLRTCTNRENTMNSKSRSGTSLFKGVCLSKNGKWKAQIRVERKLIHLGYFKEEYEGALAYNNAAKKYFKEFARLNVV